MSLFVSAFAMQTLGNANKRFSSYLNEHAAVVNTVMDVCAAVNERAIAACNLILVSSESGNELVLEAVTEGHERMQDSLKNLLPLVNADSYASEKDRTAVREMAEESMETSQKLKAGANTLVSAVGQFKLDRV